jgi:cysteine desulfurase
MPDTTYLDHAATTPMHPAAVAALTAELERVGNPSSAHDAGRAARRVVEESRELLAARLGARPTEVLFTGGGTEADNLAIKGLFWARSGAEPRRRRVLVSAVEHHAVLDAALWLGAHEGAEAVVLPVDGVGRLRLDALEAELAAHADEVALVSVMWANNEVGTVQPIAEVVALAHRYGIPVHSDAVQAVSTLPVDFAASGLDAMSTSAHKLGGPVGVGALLLRRDLAVTSVQHGGGQERGIRSGTFATPLIRSFAVAVDEAVADRTERAARVAGLRDALMTGVLAAVPDAVVRGPARPALPGLPGVERSGAVSLHSRGHAADSLHSSGLAAVSLHSSGLGARATSLHSVGEREPGAVPDAATCLPGTLSITFPGCETDALLFLLDSHGVQCSAGSACQAGVTQTSHVLLAMGLTEADARGTVRFTFGRTSAQADVDAALAVLSEAVERARAASAVG